MRLGMIVCMATKVGAVFFEAFCRNHRFQLLNFCCAVDWNPQTYEDAIKPGAHPLSVYFTAKKLSELVVRHFAKEHPEIEVATGSFN